MRDLYRYRNPGLSGNCIYFLLVALCLDYNPTVAQYIVFNPQKRKEKKINIVYFKQKQQLLIVITTVST